MYVDHIEDNSYDRLSFTLFLALVFHGVLLFGLSFTVQKGTAIAPTLNVTLATFESQKTPDKADFLAQHNQEASGELDEVKELTTQKQAEISDIQIRDVNPLPQIKATERNQSATQLVTTTASRRQKVDNKIEANNRDNTRKQKGQRIDAPYMNAEFASLSARLDRLKQEYANRPRVRRLNSVSTKSSNDAQYMLDWVSKIERVGSENFPQSALRQSIFGKLRMVVRIVPNGDVEKVEILQSSGFDILDNAAIQIVKLAAPFDSFPSEISENADRLEIIRTWNFESTGFRTSE